MRVQRLDMLPKMTWYTHAIYLLSPVQVNDGCFLQATMHCIHTVNKAIFCLLFKFLSCRSFPDHFQYFPLSRQTQSIKLSQIQGSTSGVEYSESKKDSSSFHLSIAWSNSTSPSSNWRMHDSVYSPAISQIRVLKKNSSKFWNFLWKNKMGIILQLCFGQLNKATIKSQFLGGLKLFLKL